MINFRTCRTCIHFPAEGGQYRRCEFGAWPLTEADRPRNFCAGHETKDDSARTKLRFTVALAAALAFYSGYATAGDTQAEPTACEVRADKVAEAYRTAKTIEVGGGLLADLAGAAINGRNPGSGASSAIRNGSRSVSAVAAKRQQELERCERENDRSVRSYRR